MDKALQIKSALEEAGYEIRVRPDGCKLWVNGPNQQYTAEIDLPANGTIQVSKDLPIKAARIANGAAK